MMKNHYNKTITACFTGYIVQAVVNNFVPLLILTFRNEYGIPLEKITLLITINFTLQLCVDLVSVTFVDRIGYRASMIIAHACAAAGLILLAVLPGLFSDPFTGLVIAVIFYAAGGGLLEVLVSPVVEACPSDNKEKAMSMLHSFYCWGYVGVVLFSTIFFKFFSISNWKILSIIWAAVPAVNMIVFTQVPVPHLIADGEKGMTLKELFKTKVFWLFMLLMLCAGASEQAVSQWASAFAEKGLGINKTLGDLAGPMAFAVLMGAARLFYGRHGEKINLDKFMKASVVLCIISYLCISFIKIPAVGLAGCALTGLSVGILWPGTFSKASSAIKRGGTSLFALLALAGDLGCSGGPTLVGIVSGAFSDNLRAGILAAVIFPVLMLAGLLYRSNFTKNRLPG
jgi:fucose permease